MNNIIKNNYASSKPEVGMGATELMYSDRHAYTIIEICTPKKIRLQRDKATRADSNGMSDAQSYTYECDPNGEIITATLRKDGHWRISGNNHVVMLGARREYYDYSF